MGLGVLLPHPRSRPSAPEWFDLAAPRRRVMGHREQEGALADLHGGPFEGDVAADPATADFFVGLCPGIRGEAPTLVLQRIAHVQVAREAEPARRQDVGEGSFASCVVEKVVAALVRHPCNRFGRRRPKFFFFFFFFFFFARRSRRCLRSTASINARRPVVEPTSRLRGIRISTAMRERSATSDIDSERIGCDYRTGPLVGVERPSMIAPALRTRVAPSLRICQGQRRIFLADVGHGDPIRIRSTRIEPQPGSAGTRRPRIARTPREEPS